MTEVEICEDMACVILHEVARETASLCMNEISKKPKAGSVCIVEECLRANLKNKWWVVSLYYNKSNEVCP